MLSHEQAKAALQEAKIAWEETVAALQRAALANSTWDKAVIACEETQAAWAKTKETWERAAREEAEAALREGVQR